MTARPATAVAIALAAIVALSGASCYILSPEQFCVLSWRPGDGSFVSGDDLSVSVTFSAEPVRTSAESAFSMTGNGAGVTGAFSWDGSTMAFIPFMPLRLNVDYRISVGTGAMEPGGLSLDESFEGRFTTRPEDGRPSVLATVPERGGIMEDVLDPVIVFFSEPVDAATYRCFLSFSPTASGFWSLGPDGSSATFTPLEPWAWATEYVVAASADLADVSGNSLGEPWSTRFAVGVDRLPPVIVIAEAIDRSGTSMATLIPDDAGDGTVTLNSGWEAAWRFRLTFSEPVSIEGLESRVTVEGGPAMTLESLGGTVESAVFSFDERPDWGDRIAVRLRAGIEDARGNAIGSDTVFRIVADGSASKPPRFVGIRLPLAPGEPSPGDRDLQAFAVDRPYATLAIEAGALRYPVGAAVPTSIELYVETAPGASLDILSIMDSFRAASSNGAIEFSADRVTIAGLDYEPPYGPWSGCSIARIDGTMTNRPASGVVTFTLAAGFIDSAGNPAAAAQCLALLK